MIMTGLKYIDLAKQQFLIEKEENIRYIVNILFLIIGVGLSIIKLKG